jgi:hypothetical protein
LGKRIHKNDELKRRFVQVDKILLENPQYEKLSEGAILAYSILRDRLDLSKENADVYTDDEGYLYLIYTDEELGEILHRTRQTANSRKKELKKYGLLDWFTPGQNQPNRLYICEPDYCDPEEYISKKYRARKKAERDQKAKAKLEEFHKEEKEAETLEGVGESKILTPGSQKNVHPEVEIFGTIETEVSELELKETEFLVVNQEKQLTKNIIDICNSFYSTYAPGRWSKKQWVTLIQYYVDGFMRDNKQKEIKEKNWDKYIESSIKTIARKHDIKYGKAEPRFLPGTEYRNAPKDENYDDLPF